MAHTAADGTHPTGMHSCFNFRFWLKSNAIYIGGLKGRRRGLLVYICFIFMRFDGINWPNNRLGTPIRLAPQFCKNRGSTTGLKNSKVSQRNYNFTMPQPVSASEFLRHPGGGGFGGWGDTNP